jgi:hypothetical protein
MTSFLHQIKGNTDMDSKEDLLIRLGELEVEKQKLLDKIKKIDSPRPRSNQKPKSVEDSPSKKLLAQKIDSLRPQNKWIYNQKLESVEQFLDKNLLAWKRKEISDRKSLSNMDQIIPYLVKVTFQEEEDLRFGGLIQEAEVAVETTTGEFFSNQDPDVFKTMRYLALTGKLGCDYEGL